MRTFSNKRKARLPVLGSMLKLALDRWAGGGDMNFDKELKGAILSCKDNIRKTIDLILKLFMNDILIMQAKFLT
jgi:hypothetical protein